MINTVQGNARAVDKPKKSGILIKVNVGLPANFIEVSCKDARLLAVNAKEIKIRMCATSLQLWFVHSLNVKLLQGLTARLYASYGFEGIKTHGGMLGFRMGRCLALSTGTKQSSHKSVNVLKSWLRINELVDSRGWL